MALSAAAHPADSLRVAVIGGGWAGMAAAVHVVQAGHRVTVFEAAPRPGGRARGVPLALPDGRQIQVDSGQHILIGAYNACLELLRTVGTDPETALLRLPLALQFADGTGLRLPDWPAPLDALWGITRSRGWRWRDRFALLRAAASWRRAGFACDPQLTVAQLCAGLPARLVTDFIEPLCISALNTALDEASAQAFLRVLQDGLMGTRGCSNLLLPRRDLGTLWPEAAARWLVTQGAHVLTRTRVEALHRQASHWHINERAFDHVICATSAPDAARLMASSASGLPPELAHPVRHWSQQAAQLTHRPIATVYAQVQNRHGAGPLLSAPMLALRSSAQAPAQFVFDRDAITGLSPTDEPSRLLAFVISHSSGDRATLEVAITAQAHAQLGLQVRPLLTVIDKRATFTCSAGLIRPDAGITTGLHACGDYVNGPYPATLEGAVLSGIHVAAGFSTWAGSH